MLHSRPSQSNDLETGILNEPESLQEEFNRLEELIFQSNQIPLSRWIHMDEKQLLDQLELLRENWPEAFAKARVIIEQRQQIIEEAEEYAENTIAQAQQQAAKMLDETGIIQQAHIEADLIREQAKQESLMLQQQTLAQIEEARSRALEEILQMRQLTIVECEEIQDGADDYAEEVLSSIEQQLTQILKIIRNGRKQLNKEILPPPSP